jgi:hypothetical protein
MATLKEFQVDKLTRAICREFELQIEELIFDLIGTEEYNLALESLKNHKNYLQILEEYDKKLKKYNAIQEFTKYVDILITDFPGTFNDSNYRTSISNFSKPNKEDYNKRAKDQLESLVLESMGINCMFYLSRDIENKVNAVLCLHPQGNSYQEIYDYVKNQIDLVEMFNEYRSRRIIAFNKNN